MADIRHDFGHFQLPITSLFMVRYIKCRSKRKQTVENKRSYVLFGWASVDNHIPRDDIFDYHPLRECNIYIILLVNIT